MCFSDFFAPKGRFVSAIKQMRFFFSACTSEYESSFRSFPIRITKNSRLLMFAAAILRSCNDRSVDRNYFSGVCNERKIIEKFSEHPIIRREKSEAMRLSRFPFPDLAAADPVFTVQSGRHKHRQTAILIVWKEWLLVIFLAI